jgi:hypothetical protein
MRSHFLKSIEKVQRQYHAYKQLQLGKIAKDSNKVKLLLRQLLNRK